MARPSGFFDVERNAALIGIEVKKVKAFFRMRHVVFEGRNAPRLSPDGASILMTSAPMSASSFVQCKPKRPGDIENAVTAERSRSSDCLHEIPQCEMTNLIRSRFLLGHDYGVKARRLKFRVSKHPD